MDVRTAAAEFDRAAVADVESAAEDERKQVLSQFPLQGWAELPLKRYALGQGAPPEPGPTYCRLSRVAADAQRYCQTRFLCDKYGLPLPAALATDRDDDTQTDAT